MPLTVIVEDWLLDAFHRRSQPMGQICPTPSFASSMSNKKPRFGLFPESM